MNLSWKTRSVYMLHSDSDFRLQNYDALEFRIENWIHRNFAFSKNIKTGINFVPIKTVGFSHLVCSSNHRLPKREEKISFKHCASRNTRRETDRVVCIQNTYVCVLISLLPYFFFSFFFLQLSSYPTDREFSCLFHSWALRDFLT